MAKDEETAEAAETAAPEQGIKWRAVALIVVAFIVLWGTALGVLQSTPDSYFGWVMVAVVGVLTVVAIGFGIYIWRLTKRSKGIQAILAEATDAEGRKRALEKLEAGDSSDAMNALARARLVGEQGNPGEAMKILEEIDIEKAPAPVQDDIRANLGLMYLVSGRAKDARKLADEIRLDRQPNATSKAMYAAMCAEAFARTGAADEAVKLLETYKPSDPEYGDAQAMLWRADFYASMARKKRGRAQTALNRLAKIDENQLGPFIGKGARPMYQKMAMKALKSAGKMPKQKMKVQRRM